MLYNTVSSCKISQSDEFLVFSGSLIFQNRSFFPDTHISVFKINLLVKIQIIYRYRYFSHNDRIEITTEKVN